MSPDALAYAPLWCKSNFSFLEGASHPDELVETAHRFGLTNIAITDRDGVYGLVRAHEKARELGIETIVGSEVSIDDGTTLVLLAENRCGYANLCRLISVGRLRCPKGQSRVSWNEVCSHADGLIALWGGDASAIVRETLAQGLASAMKQAFGERLFAMTCRHHRADELERERYLREHAKVWELPIVAATEVLYHTPARRPLQDVLTCIRHGVALHHAGRRIKQNAEHDLKHPYAFARLFADDEHARLRTLDVAMRCRFSLAELRYRYPSERLPDGTTSSQWLRTLAFAGAAQRYSGAIPREVSEQLDKELGLIDELDYCGYFLTMYEIVEFCRQENILCQGRGSAANSAVCHSLGITAVDPVRMGLLFERFLSRERAEPPDIDLDIEHDRREQVIQHMYRKYGREHAAMVANVIRYRTRSAIRDVGKVLGFPETTLDRLAKGTLYYDELDDRSLEIMGLDPRATTHQHLLRLSREILDFPRHLSIHPGGFLLGHDPIATLVPIENATMDARTVIQWDKYDIEALGLFKVDLLGLGALRQLHLCFDLLREHRGIELSMAAIPPDDAATYDMICEGDTVGVFQIESRAQMSMLPRLRPRSYYDLVIEISIVRPGPITGGMVHPYLRRRGGREAIEYPHALLEPVLKKTLGVPLFQEQVMRLAVVAADYTPGEADQLRRDMAAWRYTGRIEQHRDKLITRMERKGIAREFAENVFKQICGFGEYGFPESHAASFALISYAGSWLKYHYPAEFACSLLNAWPMGFYAPATVIEDAKRHGVEVRAIDVLHSDWECTLEPTHRSEQHQPMERRLAIRIGLRYVKQLAEVEARKIVAAARTQPFESIDELVRCTDANERSLKALAEAGAFESLDPDRRAALWSAYGLARARPLPLAVDLEPKPELAALDAFETITWDYQSTGLSPRGHPLEPLRQALRAQRLPDARSLQRMPHGRRVKYAGMVICRQRPGTASGVTFMTLEDETGFVNIVLWPSVFQAHALLAQTQQFLGVTGQLQAQDNVVHLIAQSLWKPQVAVEPTHAGSRDFH